MAFFLDRYGREFSMDFQQVISDRVIPNTYKTKLEEHFKARGRKDPRGNASVYERSLRLLLEYISGQGSPPPERFAPVYKEHENKEMKPVVFVSQPIDKSTNTPNHKYDCKRAGEHLVQIGKERFALKSDHPWVHLTGIEKYDTLLNDLENTPHTFVLACLMDKQIKAERAWAIPCIIMEEYGTDIHVLSKVSQEDYIEFFNRNTLHRFNNEMGKVFKSGVQRIVDYYNGNASLIWEGKPSSAKVVYDFLQFRGAGVKIATMAVNILARQFQVKFADYYSIDVSPDVHIRRVMYRMGLVDDELNTDAVIYKARELNPDFPGIIDFSAWEIGREYCRPNNPRCSVCSVNAECLRRL
jgi:endonuclease III